MVWCLPTLNRPRQCAAALESIRNVGSSSRGIVFVNGIDKYDIYRKEVIPFLPKEWHMQLWAENIGCLGALNWIFNQYPRESWYGFFADDEYLLPESPPDWDKRLIEAAGQWGIAHSWESWNDGKRMQGAVIIGGKLARAVGYLAWKECAHNFGFDCLWEWLNGYAIFGGGGLHNIKYVPEVRVYHRRSEGKIDGCYRLAESTLEADREAFWKWRTEEMSKAIERIKRAKAA